MSKLDKIKHSTENLGQIRQFLDYDAISDSTVRRDYLEHLNGDDFIDLIQQSASVVRTGNSDTKQHFDGESVKVPSLTLPDHRDKEELLRDTWEVAQGFLQNQDLSDDDALQLAAITAAGGIAFAHPFIDGNGRTSRLVALQIATGGRVSDDNLKKILTESRGGEAWYPGVPGQSRLMNYEFSNFPNIKEQAREYKENKSIYQEDTVESAILDSGYERVAVALFLNLADDNAKNIASHFKVYDQSGELNTMHISELVCALVRDPENGITYASQMLQIIRRCREETTKSFLASMMDDEYTKPNYLFPRILNVEQAPPELKLSTQRLAEEFSKRAINGLIRPRDEALVSHRARSGVYHDDSKESF